VPEPVTSMYDHNRRSGRSICSVERCESYVNGHGLCQKHQIRLQKYGSVHGGLRNQAPAPERFARKIEYDPNGGCWLWSGAHHARTGYGSFQEGGHGSAGVGAHCYSYRLHKGPIPAGLEILHSCDVRLCVNPDHLSVGTHLQNMQDMHAKRRATRKPRPAKAPRRKLSDDAIRQIRAQREVTAREMADRFGITTRTVWQVRSGDRWAQIT
jgi:hypothetical protein